MAGEADPRTFYTRITVIIAACTLVLTLSFIGILSIVDGEFTSDRLPWYLVVAALSFVATIVLLEAHGATGREIILTSSITAIWVFVLIGLAVEGLLYAIHHTDDVFNTRLILYFVAAALLATGIAYWALHHWREFTGRSATRL